MNSTIIKMVSGACSLRNRWALMLSVLVATGVTLAAPSESTSQPRATELVGATVEDLGQGQGVRLILKTRNDTPIAPTSIGFKGLRDIIRVNVWGAYINRNMGYQTPIVGVRDTKRVRKGYLYRHRRASFARLQFDAPAREALRGYRIEAHPQGIAIVFPFGQALPLEAVSTDTTAPSDTATTDKPDTATGDTTTTDTTTPSNPDEPSRNPVKTTAEATPKETTPPADGTASAAPLPVSSKEAPGERPGQGSSPRAAEEPLLDNKSMLLVGLLLVSLLVIASLMLSYMSLTLQRPKPLGPEPDPKTSLPLDQARILAGHRIDEQTEILFMELLGEVMAFSKSRGSLQLLYRLGPEAATMLYDQVGESMPERGHASARGVGDNASDEHRASSSLFESAPLFETTSDDLEHSPSDFGYTLEALSREIHLKAMEENRGSDASSISQLFKMDERDSNSDDSSPEEPGTLAHWLKRVPSDGSVEDSDLFKVFETEGNTDRSEVPDESMIDISFVIDEKERLREKKEEKERVVKPPPIPDVSRKS
ncbi:MAG: hypothetical protein AAFX99_03470 [Myxococcota bacterium]